MIVDASAIVAVILEEEDAEELLTRLLPARHRATTVVSAFEAVMAVGRVLGDEEAPSIVREFLRQSDIEMMSADGDLLGLLSDAFRKYGRRSGHPAQLNMGDCFSYAMAKTFNVPLLYKGNDFAQTDLA